MAQSLRDRIRPKPLEGEEYDPNTYTVLYQEARSLYANGERARALTAAQELLERARAVRDELRQRKKLHVENAYTLGFLNGPTIPAARLLVEDVAKGVPELRGPGINTQGMWTLSELEGLDSVLHSAIAISIAGTDAFYATLDEHERLKEKAKDWQTQLDAAATAETFGLALDDTPVAPELGSLDVAPAPTAGASDHSVAELEH
jgi:hypothetical protein